MKVITKMDSIPSYAEDSSSLLIAPNVLSFLVFLPSEFLNISSGRLFFFAKLLRVQSLLICRPISSSSLELIIRL